METQNSNTQRTSMDKALFSWTDNRIVAIAFLIAFPSILILRRVGTIGIRLLKVEMIAFLLTAMSLIMYISDWMQNLPLIGSTRRTDFAAWKIFIFITGALFVLHLVRAFQATKKLSPYPYTRGLGSSWLFPLFKDSPLKFIKKEMDFQLYIESLFTLVCSVIVHETIAPNLGKFLFLSAISQFIVSWQIRENIRNIFHDANDAISLSKP